MAPKGKIIFLNEIVQLALASQLLLSSEEWPGFWSRPAELQEAEQTICLSFYAEQKTWPPDALGVGMLPRLQWIIASNRRLHRMTGECPRPPPAHNRWK
jgi:hypothetical protein